MRLLVPNEEKSYGDPPMLSFHGDPIPEIQRTFLDSDKKPMTLHIPCWESLHISGYQLTFNDGRHTITLQSTKTKKKPATWCCDELQILCSDNQIFQLIGVTLENENGYDVSGNALTNFQDDIRFLVAMYDRLFLEGSETYRPKARAAAKKKGKSKNLIPDGIVRKFGAKDVYISLRSAMGGGLPLPIKGLATPPENTTTFESVALFLHMLSYMTEGSIERTGLTISMAVRDRNLPVSRLTFETDTPSKADQTPLPRSESLASFLEEAKDLNDTVILIEDCPNRSNSEAQSVRPGNQMETKLTIYCTENLSDHVGCIPYSSRDLGTILVMVIMILFYLLCFVGFYTDVMEKYRNMANSTHATPSPHGSINITNVTAAPDIPL